MGLTTLNPGPLQAIGTALIARLQLAFPPTLFTHQMMPARLTATAWAELTRRVPFVGLGWNDIVPAPDMQRDFRGTSHWTVYLVTRNSSGELGRYFGDAQGPGLLQMVQAATTILQGADMGSIGTASVHRASNAVAEGWESGNAVIAALDVGVPVDLGVTDVIDPASLSIDNFITDAITWDFLPATASLTDIITLGTP